MAAAFGARRLVAAFRLKKANEKREITNMVFEKNASSGATLVAFISQSPYSLPRGALSLFRGVAM
jgi:hypothetical protein